MPSLTETIGDFAASMRDRPVPDEAVPVVRTGFTDCIACMIAGRNEPVVGIVRGELASVDDGRGARLALGAERAAAREAALVNGTAAHALDYDDVALSAHPSAVLVAALLAEGEALDASGMQLIRAYLAGYEIWAECARRDQDHHHRKGWHPTSVFGTIAAAAACAVLHGLDATHARASIAIAASMAGGLVANFGTMTKPFHAGRAAESGVLAARLARAGMTASPDALEHPLGFLRAISPAGRVDTDGDTRLGRDWQLPKLGLNVKKYPLCYSTHRSLDAMIDLKRRHGFGPDDVVAIEVEMSETQAAVLRNHAPRSGLDAKFSEEFAMAAAVVAGQASLAELTDAFVQRRDVQKLMAKVHVKTNALADPEDPVFSPDETVVVGLRDGRRVASGPIRYARGHAHAPLSADELWGKFADCLSTVCAPATARRLFDKLQALERLDSVRGLPSVTASASDRQAS